MASENNKYVRIQILISLLTLFITPLLSGVVVFFQLSKQHQLWVEQRKSIKSDDKQAAKIRFLNDLNISYLNYLNAEDKFSRAHITYVELMARRELAEDTKILLFDTTPGLRPSSKEFENAGEQITQRRDDYDVARRQLVACLGAVATSNEFSSDVVKKTMNASETVGLSGPDIPQLNELSLKYINILREYHRTKDLGKYIESSTQFRDTYLLPHNENFCLAMKELFKLMYYESIGR